MSRPMNVHRLIARHLAASGPASFASIREYIRAQHQTPLQDWQIVRSLNLLLRSGIARVYDTGNAFDTGPETMPEQPLWFEDEPYQTKLPPLWLEPIDTDLTPSRNTLQQPHRPQVPPRPDRR